MIWLRKLIIKIGGNMDKDIAAVFKNPSIVKESGTHIIYLKSVEEFSKLLTPRRIELLLRLVENQEKRKSITQLAKELKRKQEAISRDINFLEVHDFVDKMKDKKNVYAFTKYKSIELSLA